MSCLSELDEDPPLPPEKLPAFDVERSLTLVTPGPHLPHPSILSTSETRPENCTESTPQLPCEYVNMMRTLT